METVLCENIFQHDPPPHIHPVLIRMLWIADIHVHVQVHVQVTMTVATFVIHHTLMMSQIN